LGCSVQGLGILCISIVIGIVVIDSINVIGLVSIVIGGAVLSSWWSV